jgi:heme-degrading monooxygenase HmoA
VAEEDQASLVDALGPGQDYLLETPGYRSHSVFRGVGARYYEGSFVVVYAQWDGKEAYDRYRNQPEAEQPDPRKKTQARLAELVTLHEWNTYRVVHSRSAGQ